MSEAEPPDEYYRALGKIVAMAARLELTVLELALAIERGEETQRALIDYFPDYSRPGAVLSYANRAVQRLSDENLRASVLEYLGRVAALLLERHAATHGVVAAATAIGEESQRGAGGKHFWLIFDAKTKSMREMSIEQMGALADSLGNAEPEGKNLRDIIAPPPDRTARTLLAREYLRRRAAGEDTAELKAALLEDSPPRPAPRHDWQFRGSLGQRDPSAG